MSAETITRDKLLSGAGGTRWRRYLTSYGISSGLVREPFGPGWRRPMARASSLYPATRSCSSLEQGEATMKNSRRDMMAGACAAARNDLCGHHHGAEAETIIDKATAV